MSLDFIYGPACCDHETPLVEKATEWLLKDKKNEVYYLVPNHIKFETEVSVLRNLHQLPAYQEWDNMATMRLQVFSFTRLAWYFLQNTSYYNDNRLSEAGTHMLIRKILKEEEENLIVFRGEMNKPGFIGKLADLFQEFQEGNIEIEDLEHLIMDDGESLKQKDFSQKLKDFTLLYNRYLNSLNEQELSSTQLISHLANYLKEADLNHVMFIVSGFSRFTAKERKLIETLIECAANVTINLVLDKKYVQALPEKFSLFYDSGKLYFDTYHFAREKKIPISQDTQLRTNETNEMLQLDEFWRDSQKLSPLKRTDNQSVKNIKVWEADTPYTELSAVAREIRRLVADEGIRYKDIEILTRDLPHYETVIAPVLETHDIPFYTNRELEMKHHPLVEFFQTLFAIKTRNFRYHDVMRFLRTELFLPIEKENYATAEWMKERDSYRDKIDLTENVVLAYGYEGYYWTQEKDWVYVQYDYEEDKAIEEDENIRAQRISNIVRRDVRSRLLPFYEELNEAEKGEDAARLLYHFLVDIGVEQELIYWRNQDIENGLLEDAKIHEQTWQAFVLLLDEYVAILGDEPFELDTFVEIISSGMEGLTYSKVPTSIDQVSISSLDLIHATKNKITFIIGATDSVLPGKIENKTLLSDEERSLVDESLTEEKFLIKNTSSDIAKEPYIAYLAFQSASEKLYLSYPTSSEHVKESKISPYAKRIVDGLGVTIETFAGQLRPDEFQIEQIGTYRSLLTDITKIKQEADEGKEFIHPIWLQLENELLKQPAYSELTKRVFDSIVHKNIPEALEPEIVEALYGNTIHASVSKIESFHLCHYKYFMNYGLKLKERDVFGLTPAATGDFFHDSLDTLFKVLIRENLMLSELTPGELQQVTEKVLIEVLGANKFAILNASNRMNYIRYQLSKTIQRVGWALHKQSIRTGMTTLQTEVLFGQIMNDKGIAGLSIPLTNKREIKVRGKIDRLDGMEIDDEMFLAVIDYKSSRHSFDYRDVYYGIAMQMITYLDIAMTSGVELVGKDKVSPAGAFYLHIQNPLLEGGMEAEKEEEELLKQFKYKGLLLEEEKLIEKLDPSLEASQYSSVYPFYLTAKEQYTSKQYVTEEEMQSLIAHNRRNFKKAGEQIYEGDVRLNPAYAQKKRLACEYCPFRSVCQFDVMLKENEYHRLEQLKKEDVFGRIDEQKGGE